MAEINFNALARPGPRGFTQGFQQADAQMMVDETNRTAQEVNRFKLEELKRDRDEMMQLQEQLKGMGQDPDLDKLMDVYARSGRPDYVKMGLEGKQKLKEQREYAKLIESSMAAPAAPAAAPSVMRMPQAPAPTNVLGSGTFGMEAPTNALAPSAPAAAAPVNAMAPSPHAGQIQQTQKRIDDLMRFAATNPGMAGQAMAQAKLLQDQLEMYARAKTPETAKLADRFVPVGRLVFDRETQQYISPSQAQLTQSQERSTAPRPERAPRTQQTTLSDGTIGLVNMDTGEVMPVTMAGVPVKGKPSPFAEKAKAQRAQMGKDLDFAITQLSDITKDGGLIDQSTGSGIGRGVDVANRFVGRATSGDIAIGKIAPIADLVLKMIPRFEGPQSDKDTASYKEAAGQLADPTLPTKIRKEAGKTVLRLMQQRKGQFGISDMAAEDTLPAAPSASDRPEGVGADWTLMTDKNNKKAWVSPDRKSFKEVK